MYSNKTFHHSKIIKMGQGSMTCKSYMRRWPTPPTKTIKIGMTANATAIYALSTLPPKRAVIFIIGSSTAGYFSNLFQIRNGK